MKIFVFLITLMSLMAPHSIYSQNKPDTVEFNIQKKYIDKKMAWYLNATGLKMNTGRYDILGYGAGTFLEMKLWNSHSISAGINLLNIQHQPRLISVPGYSNNYFSIHLELNYRYYHNLNGRMTRGLTGNNFNANYIVVAPYLLSFKEPYRTETVEWDFEKGEWKISSSRKVNLQPYLRIGYGLQRNVWKDFNLDINSGFQINQLPDFRDPLSLFYLQFNVRYTIK